MDPVVHHFKIHLNSSTNSSLETCVQSFDSIQQLKNGKKYHTVNSTKMNESNSTGGSPNINALERNVENELEVHVSTQEKVNEQIGNHIAMVT